MCALVALTGSATTGTPNPVIELVEMTKTVYICCFYRLSNRKPLVIELVEMIKPYASLHLNGLGFVGYGHSEKQSLL